MSPSPFKSPVRVAMVGLGFCAEFIPLYQAKLGSEVAAVEAGKHDSCTVPIATSGADESNKSEHILFAQGNGYEGSHSHLVHEFTSSGDVSC